MRPAPYTRSSLLILIERQIELMRRGFKLPDRLLFNARSEGIEASKFWRDAFLTVCIIVPADGIFEWNQLCDSDLYVG